LSAANWAKDAMSKPAKDCIWGIDIADGLSIENNVGLVNSSAANAASLALMPAKRLAEAAGDEDGRLAVDAAVVVVVAADVCERALPLAAEVAVAFICWGPIRALKAASVAASTPPLAVLVEAPPKRAE
jgi:hypothetical protein